MLHRLALDAVKCRQYAEEYFDFGLGPGILNSASGRHAQARGEVVGLFDDVEVRARADRDNVAAAISSYESTDLRRAGELDAVLPGVQPAHRQGHSPVLRPDFLQRPRPA